jgi:colicin import membrane protein
MMNRFEKKCFIGSAGFHGLLLVVFVFGSAFMAKDTLLKDMGPVVTIDNVKVTDGPNTGGGNPNANPAPPAQNLAQPPVPQPKPPDPEPPKVAKPPEPEPDPPKQQEPLKKTESKSKELPKKEMVKDKGEIPVKPVPKNNSAKSDISTTVVKRTNNIAQLQKEAAARAAKDKADREAWERYNQQRLAIAKEAGRVASGAAKGLTHSTVVEASGPGGEAYVNYGSFVREIYDRAWLVSPDLADDDSSAVARITIRRDGTVRSAVLSKASTNASLNKSIRRALDAVREIGKPFPEGAKELERTFNIEFNLKSRRAVG